MADGVEIHDHDVTRTDRAALIVNLSALQLLSNLSGTLFQVAWLRFHRMGPRLSRAQTSQRLYGDDGHTEAIRTKEHRLARQLWRQWRQFEGWDEPLRHDHVSTASGGQSLSACTACGRLIWTRLPIRSLPSDLYSVCGLCYAEGYHPLRLFPEGLEL